MLKLMFLPFVSSKLTLGPLDLEFVPLFQLFSQDQESRSLWLVKSSVEMWFAFALPELIAQSMWEPQYWVPLPAPGWGSTSHHCSVQGEPGGSVLHIHPGM